MHKRDAAILQHSKTWFRKTEKCIVERGMDVVCGMYFTAGTNDDHNHDDTILYEELK